MGGASSKGWAEYAPVVGIGLIDLPKIEGARGATGTPGSGIPAPLLHGDKFMHARNLYASYKSSKHKGN